MQTTGTQTRSPVFCDLVLLSDTLSLDIFSVQHHSFQWGVLKQGHTHGWSLSFLAGKRLRSWVPQLEDLWPISPFLWSTASTITLFAQKMEEGHFRRIWQTWFSSQTELLAFRRELEALDPEVAQALSCMHVRGAYWMGSVPSTLAPILFIISSLCGNWSFDE